MYKELVVKGAPTLFAVIIAIIGHTIGFEELKQGALVTASILLWVAIVCDWPRSG